MLCIIQPGCQALCLAAWFFTMIRSTIPQALLHISETRTFAKRARMPNSPALSGQAHVPQPAAVGPIAHIAVVNLHEGWHFCGHSKQPLRAAFALFHAVYKKSAAGGCLRRSGRSMEI